LQFSSHKEFTINTIQVIYYLEGLAFSGTEKEVNNSINILEEYNKMLRPEKMPKEISAADLRCK